MDPKDKNELAHFRASRLAMARLMLVGHPAGPCGMLLSDLLIIIFRAFYTFVIS
jgi:hypothetical protein